MPCPSGSSKLAIVTCPNSNAKVTIACPYTQDQLALVCSNQTCPAGCPAGQVCNQNPGNLKAFCDTPCKFGTPCSEPGTVCDNGSSFCAYYPNGEKYWTTSSVSRCAKAGVTAPPQWIQYGVGDPACHTKIPNPCCAVNPITGLCDSFVNMSGYSTDQMSAWVAKCGNQVSSPAFEDPGQPWKYNGFKISETLQL